MPRRYVAGLFRPTPEGAYIAPEGEGGINRNIPPRHAIMDLLPIESPEVLFSMVISHFRPKNDQ